MTSEGKDTTVRISILIPVYNVERYLIECLESILQQSRSVYEVILVNDGSTDKSGAICDYYAEKYSFIKSFHKENQGLLSARRYGISKATGNWYVFLDSDDTLKENCIEILCEYIKNYDPDCVIYGFDRVQDRKIKAFEPELQTYKLITDKSEFYELVFTHSALNSLCRKAVRAELLSRDYSQYFHISLAEDLLQSIEIYEKGNCFLYIPISLYNYRYNETSITNTIKIQNYKVDFSVRQLVLSFLEKEDVFSQKQWESYNNYSLKVFLDQVKTILTFDASTDEIKKLLDKVRDTRYYREYISKVDSSKTTGAEKIILSGLRKRQYAIMIGMNKVYRIKKRFQ